MASRSQRHSWSLASQVAALTALVALAAVAVSFLVSASLIAGASTAEARRTLGHYADLVADGVTASGTPLVSRLRPRRPAARALFRVAQITPVRVLPGGAVVGNPTAPLPTSLVHAAAAGDSLDTDARLAGRKYLAAVRPLSARAGSVVLLQPSTAAGQIGSPFRSRLLIALAIGLVVAAAAGTLLAQRLARPLTTAAAAAGELARGRRDVRLSTSGPTEVAAVGESLNELAGALAASESRQRDFLFAVSHELRTPLTAITGYAEALTDGMIEPAELPAVGQTVKAEAARLQRLVDDLMELGRAGADDFAISLAPVDLPTLVRDAAAAWRLRCEPAGVRLSVAGESGELWVRTDAARVRQMIDGLADNALRLMPDGGVLVFAVTAEPDAAVVEIRDSGPGLTDDDLEVAFDRAVLRERYAGQRPVGNGIGLALVARLARRLGGEIRAGHAPEGGAGFSFTLPRSSD